jgi:hypothetical protein
MSADVPLFGGVSFSPRKTAQKRVYFSSFTGRNFLTAKAN